MNYELKMIGVKLLILLFLTPLMGLGVMQIAEGFEKAWKTKNRKKKWMISCGAFLFIAVVGGWLR